MSHESGYLDGESWFAEDKEDLSDNLVEVVLVQSSKASDLIHYIIEKRCKALLNSHNPAYVPMLDYGIDQNRGCYYFVYEHCFHSRLNEESIIKGLSSEEKLSIFCDLADMYNVDVFWEKLTENHLFYANSQIRVKYIGLTELQALIKGEPCQSLENLADFRSSVWNSFCDFMLDFLSKVSPVPKKCHHQVFSKITEDVQNLRDSTTDPDFAKIKEIIALEIQKVKFTEINYIKPQKKVIRQLKKRALIPAISKSEREWEWEWEWESFLQNELQDRVTAWCDCTKPNSRHYYLNTRQVRLKCSIPSYSTTPPNHLLITSIEPVSEGENEMSVTGCFEVVKKDQDIPPNSDVTSLVRAIDFHVESISREAQNKKSPVGSVSEETQQKKSPLNYILKWKKVLEREKYELRYFYLEFFKWVLDIGAKTITFQIKEQKEWPIPTKEPIYLCITNKKEKQKKIGFFEDDEGETDSTSLQIYLTIHKVELEEKGQIRIDEFHRIQIERQLCAIERLENQQTVNQSLCQSLTSPQQVKITRRATVDCWFQKDKLNETQKEAIEKALATRDIFLIQGPPGTGKTSVISELVLQIFDRDPEARILLTSQSHVAVDNALNRILQLNDDKGIKKDLRSRSIRVGREEKIDKQLKNILLKKQLRAWRDEIVKAISEEEEQPVGQEWLEQIKKNEALLRSTYLNYCNIVAATCLGIAGEYDVSELQFDWVIADEAGRATPPELLVPLVRGHKLILVGDHQQLPPTIIGKTQQIIKEEINRSDHDNMKNSLFKHLIGQVDPSAQIFLDTQYRMHPHIGRLVSECFYPNQGLKDGKTLKQRTHHYEPYECSVIWLSTSNLIADEREQDSTFENECEAKVLVKVLEQINSDYMKAKKKTTVGVITGYRGQKKLLEEKIDQGWEQLTLEINTVDAYQGREQDIIIYSLVRSNRERKIGFLKDERRLNVALSRARELLILIGDSKRIKEAQGKKEENPFIKVLEHIESPKREKECLLEYLNES